MRQLDDAKAYVAWLSRETSRGYRLLTEAEWEYAARAGTTTRYWWGDDIGRGNAVCDQCGSKWDGKSTAPVGSFRPNSFGLPDMLGNSSQWVEDCWGRYDGARDNSSIGVTSGDCTFRVQRGGSWRQYALGSARGGARGGWRTGALSRPGVPGCPDARRVGSLRLDASPCYALPDGSRAVRSHANWHATEQPPENACAGGRRGKFNLVPGPSRSSI